MDKKKKLITFIIIFSVIMIILLIICGILFKSTLDKFNESYLMRNFLDGNVDSRDIEKIAIKNKKDVPKNAEKVWDVSAKHNNSIIAWITDIDNNGLYELYIGANDKVKANPNSSYMFSSFNEVTRMDLKYLDTSNVYDMYGMFEGCSKLTTLNLSNFNTGKVKDMKAMFSGCYSLTTLKLNNFDMSKVEDASYMFSTCESMELLYLNKVKFNNHINVENMFYEFNPYSTIYVRDENAKDIINVALIGNSYRPNIVIR